MPSGAIGSMWGSLEETHSFEQSLCVLWAKAKGVVGGDFHNWPESWTRD
jgi:hypothetical protein